MTQPEKTTIRLSNALVSAEVALHGAELISLVKNGTEYLWQADPEFWGRHSPVLFPMVGRVWNNILRIDGKEFSLGQHGFARDRDFSLVEASETHALFRLEADEATRLDFPFDFTLEISYDLSESGIRVGWRVINTGASELPFQIGAHPAFNLPDFDPASDLRGYFSFDNPGELLYISPAEKGCVAPVESRKAMPLTRTEAGALMEIRRETFDCDTYIFEDSQIGRIELLRRDRSPYLAVEFSAPLVALWAPTAVKPECPFICIEPWYGRCDSVGYEGEFALREWINRLAPGTAFDASYDITLF